MLHTLISRVRRNHGLEHATIHVLTDKYKYFGAQGNSIHNGFYLNIYGQVEPQAIAQAAEEALRRMKQGEHDLAIHPNCGTMLLTTAAMATLTGQGVIAFEKKRLGVEKANFWDYVNIFPTAVLAVTLMLVASRPVGLFFQSYTTSGVMGDLTIKQVHKLNPSPLTHFFRVLLGHNKRAVMTSYFVETQFG